MLRIVVLDSPPWWGHGEVIGTGPLSCVAWWKIVPWTYHQIQIQAKTAFSYIFAQAIFLTLTPPCKNAYSKSGSFFPKMAPETSNKYIRIYYLTSDKLSCKVWVVIFEVQCSPMQKVFLLTRLHAHHHQFYLQSISRRGWLCLSSLSVCKNCFSLVYIPLGLTCPSLRPRGIKTSDRIKAVY